MFPSGPLRLFQGGNPELAEEWVNTANYWAARLSKELLLGGKMPTRTVLTRIAVGNIDFEWGEFLSKYESNSYRLADGPLDLDNFI